MKVKRLHEIFAGIHFIYNESMSFRSQQRCASSQESEWSGAFRPVVLVLQWFGDKVRGLSAITDLAVVLVLQRWFWPYNDFGFAVRFQQVSDTCGFTPPRRNPRRSSESKAISHTRGLTPLARLCLFGARIFRSGVGAEAEQWERSNRSGENWKMLLSEAQRSLLLCFCFTPMLLCS